MTIFKPLVKRKESPLFVDGRPFKRAGVLKEEKNAIGGSFTTATLPVASGLANGLIAYNSDLKALVVTVSGHWVLP
jgi:hypothetical protein